MKNLILVLTIFLLLGCGDSGSGGSSVSGSQREETTTDPIEPIDTHHTEFVNFYNLEENTKLWMCVTCHIPHDRVQDNTPLCNYYCDDIYNNMQAGNTFIDAVYNVEGIDSDGDGYTNIEEILAETYPGDFSDYPQ